jgi:3-oxoadipate enol-lactonase
LLIHGLAVTGAMFNPLLPALARQHQVIVPDLRGYGRSKRLPGPYTVPQIAADLAGLLDTLGLETVDVLGYSQGGAVAQQLAQDYPARVRRLVLACTYAYNLATFQEKMEANLTPWLLRLLGTRRLIRIALRAGAFGGTIRPQQARWLEHLAASNDTLQMIQAAKAMRDFDGRSWLASIGSPTLIIAGGADKAVPLHHAQMLAHGIYGSQLQIIPGGGHLLLVTHTERFLSLVEGFLRTSNTC